MTGRYRIAPRGIFWSIQGEAHLTGFQMAFLRLSGCSMNCPGCDTDYSPGNNLSLGQLVEELEAVVPFGRGQVPGDVWVWITGGEVGDRKQEDVVNLLSALKSNGFSTALATNGKERFIPPVDWLSVSPHEVTFLGQRYGSEVKLVDGLNGLDLEAWFKEWDTRVNFMYRYVQPLSIKEGNDWVVSPASLDRCLAFLDRHPHWSLSEQRHHAWGVA